MKQQEGKPQVRPPQDRAAVDRYILVVVLLAAAVMMVTGVWALIAPGSFADWVQFPQHEHFVKDAGAFQIGIGLTLLLALIWRDALAVVLAAFVVSNTIHAINHVTDLDIGGRDSDPWLLALLSVLTGLALIRRLRQLGEPGRATSPTPKPVVGRRRWPSA